MNIMSSSNLMVSSNLRKGGYNGFTKTIDDEIFKILGSEHQSSVSIYYFT